MILTNIKLKKNKHLNCSCSRENNNLYLSRKIEFSLCY